VTEPTEESLESLLEKLNFIMNFFITNIKDDFSYFYNCENFISLRNSDYVEFMTDNYSNDVDLVKMELHLPDFIVRKLKKFLEVLNDEPTKLNIKFTE